MKTTLVCLSTLAALAIGSEVAAQAGYYGGGRGGGGGRSGGFTGDLGSSTPRLPPPPKWNPTDTVAPNLPREGGTAGHLPTTPTTAPTAAPTLNPMVPGAPRPQVGPPMLGGMRGVPVEFRRDDETLRHFAVDWSFPSTPEVEQPLSFETAIREIAGSDARPILVRRHGHAVEQEQDQRVETLLQDEELRVLSRFFHCVDLPDTTRHPEHPFANLYDPARPPLMFLTDAQGAESVGFSGLESRTQVRDAVYVTIARCYEGDAKQVAKELRRSIEDYDRLLPLERQTAADLDDAIVADGTDSSRVHKLQDRLAQVRKDLEELKAKETAISARLRPVARVAAAR